MNRNLVTVRDTIVTCQRCTRLRAYCEQIGIEKRRAFRDDTYWARPVPGFGDASARLLIVGLAPAAHGPTAPAGCSPEMAPAARATS